MLLALCAAPDGRAYPTMLCEMTGIDLDSISRHLGNLHLRGLVHVRRQGRTKWYGCDPTRVRYQTHAGRYALNLITHDGHELTLCGPLAAVARVGRADPPRQPTAPMAEPPQVAEPPRAPETSGGQTVQGEVIHE